MTDRQNRRLGKLAEQIPTPACPRCGHPGPPRFDLQDPDVLDAVDRELRRLIVAANR